MQPVWPWQCTCTRTALDQVVYTMVHTIVFCEQAPSTGTSITVPPPHPPHHTQAAPQDVLVDIMCYCISTTGIWFLDNNLGSLPPSLSCTSTASLSIVLLHA